MCVHDRTPVVRSDFWAGDPSVGRPFSAAHAALCQSANEKMPYSSLRRGEVQKLCFSLQFGIQRTRVGCVQRDRVHLPRKPILKVIRDFSIINLDMASSGLYNKPAQEGEPLRQHTVPKDCEPGKVAFPSLAVESATVCPVRRRARSRDRTDDLRVKTSRFGRRRRVFVAN